MATAVLYATDSGTTRRCAEKLAQLLGGAELYDISKRYKGPPLAGFDAVAVGGPIHMGQLHRGEQRFLQQYGGELAAQKTAYFICNCDAASTQTYFDNLFARALTSAAVDCRSFGGEIDPARLRGIYRMMVKMALKDGGEIEPASVDETAIAQLAAALSAAVG